MTESLEQARRLIADVLTHPLTDDQAVAVASVLVSIAALEQKQDSELPNTEQTIALLSGRYNIMKPLADNTELADAPVANPDWNKYPEVVDPDSLEEDEDFQ